ncbi:methylenetetrahydrofolate reductase [Corynebacterium sp. CCM 8835]|uniref:Methylenetetrahydrofolate reductase n=1 Tax=Corynebacterium antarcticum TaxID=2800405 RepID=A0A9Q4CD28_9CORY|nr:methylenetetrahydrofolate reductase [Corynebacterium antarcticum]MCK7641810.1 methylenetetrahydrofolate reductase [Corynebacterium antarcticum]MCL0245039.1 methylenetetrahydrofolate reductase [Corynebacterium antarcticum]MCX7491413.1 methylenetetrahydrofolate reductase [Corynebacterium antarcticum]MCX7537432.1 methylenetetrahydrofolate reductase [Corynebacterium antarcticum]MCX7539408.1 methylenetetrahydrofolate reductase [Corynebacterium antarcticum]
MSSSHTPAVNQTSVTEAIARSTSGRIPFSVEFMPPRDDAAEQRMWHAVETFDALGAAFVSVTYGAGGSTRSRTSRIARQLARRPLPTLVHLTLVNHTVEELEDILWTYAGVGLTNLLALRGDPPGDPTGEWKPTPGGLTYAIDLIEMTRALPETRHFQIGVASFPERHYRAVSEESDTLHTLNKLRAGAEYSITQMFLDCDHYLRLRDRLVAADPEQGAKPVIPGLMPITSLRSLRRQIELSSARLPEELERRMVKAADGDEKANAEAVREVGIEWTTNMAERLIAEGAPDLHFMTLNNARATQEVLHNLGMAPEWTPVSTSSLSVG